MDTLVVVTIAARVLQSAGLPAAAARLGWNPATAVPLEQSEVLPGKHAQVDIIRQTLQHRYSFDFFVKFFLLLSAVVASPIVVPTMIVSHFVSCMRHWFTGRREHRDIDFSKVRAAEDDGGIGAGIGSESEEEFYRRDHKKISNDRYDDLWSTFSSVSVYGLFSWSSVFLLVLLIRHWHDHHLYHATFFNVALTVFAFPVWISFYFATELALAECDVDVDARRADRVLSELHRGCPPRRMRIATHGDTVSSEVEDVPVTAAEAAEGDFAAPLTATGADILQSAAATSAWGLGADDSEDGRVHECEVQIGDSGMACLSAEFACLYIWGKNGANHRVAGAGEQVSLALAPEDEELLLLAPYPPSADQAYGRIFTVDVSCRKNWSWTSMGLFVGKASLVMSLSLLTASFCLAVAYSHSLLPHIYRLMTTGTWPCVYPRVCGLPCSSSPFTMTSCVLPLGHGQTLVPMYEVQGNDTDVMFEPSSGIASALQETRAYAGIRKYPFDGVWSVALTAAAEGYGDSRPCNLEISNNRISWLTDDSITLVQLEPPERVRSSCQILVGNRSMFCTGEGFSVMKPFPKQTGFGPNPSFREPVPAFLVYAPLDREYLVWAPTAANNGACDQDQQVLDGLCVWTRYTGAWRTPVVEDYQDALLRIGGMKLLSCRGQLIVAAESWAMVGLEMSTLCYMLIGILTVFLFIKVWEHAVSFDALNELLIRSQSREGETHERQASLTHRLKEIREETLRTNYRHPELELDLFPIIPDVRRQFYPEGKLENDAASDEQTGDIERERVTGRSAQAPDISWWLVTRIGQSLEAIWDFEAQKPILVFSTFIALSALGGSALRVLVAHSLWGNLTLYAIWDGIFFEVLLLAIVVTGGRVNARIEEGLTAAKAMVSDAEQRALLDHFEQRAYRLRLFGFSFNTNDMVSYILSWSSWGSGYSALPGSDSARAPAAETVESDSDSA